MRSELRTAEVLKKYMIRHIKAQQIGGSAALALPKSTTTVQLIPMSAKEKKLYDNARLYAARAWAL